MNVALLLEHYARVADAPDAIARLRTLVIALATQGRITGYVGPWLSTTLGEVGRWGSGGTPSKSHPEYYGGAIPWLVIGDLNDGIVEGSQSAITKCGVENSAAKIIEPGAVLIAMYGSIGKLGINSMPCATNQAIAHCHPYEDRVTRNFLFWLLRSLREDLLGRGQGVAQQNISQKILKAWPIRLPTIAEQHRIVAKVDELMAVCDHLETARTEREAARDTFTLTTLAKLDTPDPETFGQYAHFALANLAPLTTRPDQIKQLRQTILNLAVRGKLVEQDAADEPATELFQQVLRSRRDYAAERKIRGDKIPSAPDADFDLPNSWALAALGQIAVVTDPNPSHRYPSYDGGTVPLLSTREFRGEHGWSPETAQLTTEEFWLFQQDFCDFAPGDIIFARKGRLGLPRYLPNLAKFTFSHTLFLVKPMKGLLPDYLLLQLRRLETLQWLVQEMNQNTGVPTLGKAKMEHLPIALPPLLEQHRIVAKVDALMALCDQLEASLTEGEQTRSRLLEAVLHNALEPA